MNKKFMPVYTGNLRSHMIQVPEVIYQCSGIVIFGKRMKSIVFSTDVAVIRNCNADAVIAVYPFTPQPIITHALMLAADVPVFCGVGGGTPPAAGWCIWPPTPNSREPSAWWSTPPLPTKR